MLKSIYIITSGKNLFEFKEAWVFYNSMCGQCTYSKSAMQCSPAAESSSPGTSEPRSLQRLSRTGSCGRSRWNQGMNIKSTRYDQGKTKRDRDRELYIIIYIYSRLHIYKLSIYSAMKIILYLKSPHSNAFFMIRTPLVLGNGWSVE